MKLLGRIAVTVACLIAVGYAAWQAVWWMGFTKPFWRPPAVAPLGRDAVFSADLVLDREDGYLVAGVLGTREPDDDGRCSGRFAIVELDPAGSAQRAVVATGLERHRLCANEIEYLVADPGGWLVAGAGIHDARSKVSDTSGPTEGERLTLAVSLDGTPRDEFGDDGVVHRGVVVGRLDGVLLTDQLERVTDTGELRDDLVYMRGRILSTWTDAFAVDARLVVAVDRTGRREVRLQTFEVERGPPRPRLRPLRPLEPNGDDPVPGHEVEVSDRETYAEITGASLRESTLHVLRSTRLGASTTSLIAIDPRTWRLERSFGTGGAKVLSVSTPQALGVDADGGFAVAGTARDGDDLVPLRVLRLTMSGAVAWTSDNGSRLLGEEALGASAVGIDPADRVVVLSVTGQTLVRLTPRGRVDASFGNRGRVDLGRVDPCELAPARTAEVCARD